MSTHSLKQALSKNKYLLVKRTLRKLGHRVNATDCRELDELSTLEQIEATLKSSAGELDRESWLENWFKR